MAVADDEVVGLGPKSEGREKEECKVLQVGIIAPRIGIDNIAMGSKKEESEDPILQMRGVGKEIWADTDADEYVRNLREGWYGKVEGSPCAQLEPEEPGSKKP